MVVLVSICSPWDLHVERVGVRSSVSFLDYITHDYPALTSLNGSQNDSFKLFVCLLVSFFLLFPVVLVIQNAVEINILQK